ncbi:MAG: DUF1467 family protein [Rickettsiales bacterium]|jgi:predicted secreted protein|nr:DUF1467 family protein [Rickettsiales bacterium]
MLISYIVVFTCLWWIIFYMALPFGIKTIAPTKLGHDSGAPRKPNIGLKVAITTIITIPITIKLVSIIEQGHLSSFIDQYVQWLSAGSD